MSGKQPETFHLASTPLQRGTNLLEASAGTGKTYTIAGLFVRLILEENFSVEEILVVTFTEAATAELRQRIRLTIANALKVFSGEPSSDKFLQLEFEKHAHEKSEIIARLERAMAGFDQASICTIHGFCQRTLRDRAFESGTLFDVELITEPAEILSEIAGDFWRKNFYIPRTTISVRFALKNKLAPESLLNFLRQCINHPSLKFHSRVEGKSLDDVGAKLETAFIEARDEWRRDRDKIKLLFGSHTNWGNNPYNDDDKMAECFAQLERCFADSETDYDSLKALDYFCAREITKKTSKRAKLSAPSHRFFQLCDEVAEAESDFLDAVKLDFVQFAQAELPLRKQHRKVRSFDDLLSDLQFALTSKAGPALAENLRTKYSAALIDEFQDTDPVQYEIFRRVFANGKTYLYLIGDPKQAIYAFRGADIFTYMHAAGEAERRYTLGENWRSEEKLVEAVNTIFSSATRPFVFDEIQFSPVIAKANADEKPLTVAGKKESPFQVWFYPREVKSIPKGEAEKNLPEIVASEIVKLLNDGAKIGNRTLRPEDIAVLVPINKHAQLMQEALRALNVPSVLHTAASLFESFEAVELRRVLLAIAKPVDSRLLKAALGTELLGWDGATIAAMSESETAKVTERFEQYRVKWSERGFFQMFRHWLQHESVRQRLLAFPDGERRLTNVLHLGEVLHQAESELRLGIFGLLKWLAAQMQPDDSPAEEYQLRLERDDNAVRLITIHKSKGLQYGVVFCPFNWRDSDPRRRNEKQIFFHDPADKLLLACDMGGEDYEAHLTLAERERLAENVRLMYVAITRAVHRCCFVWGAFNDAGSSAPAWLFHSPKAIEGPNLKEMESCFKGLSDGEMRAQLTVLSDASERAIEIQDLPAPDAKRFLPPESHAQELRCREFTGKISRDWRISSFSFLTAGQIGEAPDHDNEPESKPEQASGIFAFPRGTRAGSCLHEILQNVDFANSNRDGREIVEERLRAYNLLTTENTIAIESMLKKLLSTPLAPEQKNFYLSRVQKSERLNELEFCFPVSQISLPGLQAFLGKILGHSLQPTQSAGFKFDPVSGILKGFIDLVFRLDGKFYIADWKSNWLGGHVEDYHPEAMRAEMERHHYFLQYHLYTVALHKYLSLRLPGYDYGKHFGGVFYIFLRGLDPARPELGIFRDRPSLKTIEQLQGLLGAIPRVCSDDGSVV